MAPFEQEFKSTDSISFTAFCAGLKVTLTPGQQALTLVAYDGIEPAELPPYLRQVAKEIFGHNGTIPRTARRVVCAVCGARGGKTYVLGALRMLHLALTVPLDHVAPGQVASAPIIAADKDLALEALNYIAGAIESDPDLRACVSTHGRDGALVVGESITIRRPQDGREVEIVCRAASARGRTGRGRTLVGAVLDEAALFRDANYAINDEEVFRAITARVAPGGQTIVISTPWAQTGLLYTLFAENHHEPICAGVSSPPVRKGLAIAAWAPTLTIHNTEYTQQLVAFERERDPDNAAREFDAQFLTVGASQFFDEATLSQSIDYTCTLPVSPRPGDIACVGADFGFERDASAAAVALRSSDGVAHTAALLELKPRQGEPLQPSLVVAEFRELAQRYSASWLMADAHYRQTIIEHLAGSGIIMTPAPKAPDEAYVTVKARMRQGLIKIPNHPQLLSQLRAVIGAPRPGNRVSIRLPRGRLLGHCDLVSAWVLAMYQTIGAETPKPEVEQGSSDWENIQREKRRQAFKAQQDAPWWAKNLRNK